MKTLKKVVVRGSWVPHYPFDPALSEGSDL